MVKYNEEALIGVYWTEGMRETRGNGEILRLLRCSENNFRWSPQILDFQSFRTFGGNLFWEGSLVFALCSFHEPRNPHECLNKGKRSSMSSFPPWSFRSALFTFLPLSKPNFAFRRFHCTPTKLFFIKTTQTPHHTFSLSSLTNKTIKSIHRFSIQSKIKTFFLF